MSDSASIISPIPTMPGTSPSHSPRRGVGAAGPSSPRLPRASMTSRLPSFTAQGLDFDGADSPPPSSSRTSIVMGFSPVPAHQSLPAVPEGTPSSPRSHAQLALNTANRRLSSLSPQLTTPVEQTFQFAEGSPRPMASSPRAGIHHELPPRSRRNSAAIVSISLSSRSRSRTPRGSMTPLPGARTGHGTPGKSTATPRVDENGQREVMVQMAEPWAPGVEELDDWQPAGGMLLDGGDEDVAVIDDNMDGDEEDDDGVGKTWSGLSDASRAVEDILTPGTIIGEGLTFQGEVVVPAVGKTYADGEEVGMPLRRGGSEATKFTRGDGRQEKKRYEVVRRLGTGSYAVVYLVKERGGRHREYALKCLSKQDLEEEQIETQLFEAHIHLSLPIHQNIVTLHQTLQTRKWLFLMLELCPGEDLFYWLEKSRDASPQVTHTPLPEDPAQGVLSSSKLPSSSIPFSSSQMFSNLSHMSSSFSSSPGNTLSQHSQFGASPASLIFSHHNGHHHSHNPMISQTPPTPSLLSAFSAGTLLSQRRLRLIASMFSQMCEAVAVCHDAGVSHRDIKPENFICCDSIELEAAADGEFGEEEDGRAVDFGPQAKRKVVVKLTDFGLATTEEESGDVECGSKPYMSYECRNNLGPTYYPAPADVWSLGIVLINMLFHRNPWKDPTYGDPNFDNFLMDPVGFLLSKFTGIGREVASYLADHVLCIDVEARITARDFGKWIKSLPEMIGGRKALHALKMSRLENHNKTTLDKGIFVKSPVEPVQKGASKLSSALSASVLTSAAPTLSGLPPPSQLIEQDEQADEPESTMTTPPLEHDEMTSATTIDEQPTPADASGFPSPDAIDAEVAGGDDNATDRADHDSRSLSTHKRRKRGVRKGKAAQAAAAAAASGDQLSQEQRDAMLAEMAAASQDLAREISKFRKTPEFDANRIEDFPPLGTTPAQLAAEKKSKWKDLMKSSRGNPELAALARRVAERDSNNSFNLSAPAKLQQGGVKNPVLSKPAFRQTTTTSSISSALSSFGPVSSATSSSGGVDDDDWRRPARKDIECPTSPATEDTLRGRERRAHGATKRDPEETSRARNAALAAAALTDGMGPMGSFGRPSNLITKPPRHRPMGYNAAPGPALAPAITDSSVSRLEYTDAQHEDKDKTRTATPQAIAPGNQVKSLHDAPPAVYARPPMSSAESSSTITSTLGPQSSTTVAAPTTSSSSSATTTAPGVSPNKPKLKGQIHTLAKMLSGLKTKGKD
ncbi:hypothetical protein CI109_106827 [Kwoniella shandongensis]|uniref:Uncharacterized protein n=1 Tax=Kwoniella shandongensis TaxID=1734106 RepID=A0A5M6C6I1_9TREE|nr:uncharacterized protein CI109_000917 [Kwoniella shandongensis]KAA5530737.1 hypothetical protein CI109_000917 [Kwoniella shandongensis]